MSHVCATLDLQICNSCSPLKKEFKAKVYVMIHLKLEKKCKRPSWSILECVMEWAKKVSKFACKEMD